jgi:hypothetical protein
MSNGTFAVPGNVTLLTGPLQKETFFSPKHLLEWILSPEKAVVQDFSSLQKYVFTSGQQRNSVFLQGCVK